MSNALHYYIIYFSKLILFDKFKIYKPMGLLLHLLLILLSITCIQSEKFLKNFKVVLSSSNSDKSLSNQNSQIFLSADVNKQPSSDAGDDSQSQTPSQSSKKSGSSSSKIPIPTENKITPVTKSTQNKDSNQSMMDSEADAEIFIDKNQTIMGINLYVLKELVMGTHHPKAWQSQHCRQVPYFNQTGERKSCVKSSGYFYNMTTKSCDTVDIPCGDIATLNFWTDIDPCTANCTTNGVGITFVGVPAVNVDPRAICILPVVNGSTPHCQGVKKNSNITVWTYDPVTTTCYEVLYNCHWTPTLNTFAFNSTCQHMCHDITLPGSKKGHNL